MSSSLEKALTDLRALRMQDRRRDLSSHIEALLQQQWPEEEASVLRGRLVDELHRHDRHAEAEALLRAEIERDSQEPFHSLSLAQHFFYYDTCLPQAFKYVAEAISKAKDDGKFMYQALGVQARLAIEAQEWSLLEATLHSLATYEHTPGNADVFPETDFLSRIPPASVASDAISSYLQRVEYLRSINYSTMHGARGPAQ